MTNELPQYIEVDSSTYSIKVHDPLSGMLSVDHDNLLQAAQYSLCSALQKCSSASKIFVTIGTGTQSYTMGISQQNNSFFFFDSHSRTESGLC